ncbi:MULTISPECIES: signal peptidase I [unclassified Breznakia]|uniref:signal peptidase I n=1 Tax=unclassified Breznakia TaxID=2623764 RepID=UPI002405A478|nr:MULTISPECIES: signal peptidase I [unclassified Breznakia]
MEEKLKKETKKESIKIEILDFVRMILICFVFVFLCVKFVFRPVTVDGNSMYPTLVDQEFGFSNVFSTFVSDIKRFEVVVVYNEETDKLWVKRVIGLPGETVQYKSNKLYINGEIVEETFFDQEYVNSKTNNGNELFTSDYGPITLKEDEYFLCGDNRQISKDSRSPSVGPFKKNAIVSKYVIVLYPFDEMGIVSNGSK